MPDKFGTYLKIKYPRLREVFSKETSQGIFHLIDWSKTKVHTEFKGHSLWINLMGREKYGIVYSEKEYH
jgi:predicted AlkP superfamily phosphohydrolase/phosphomutase